MHGQGRPQTAGALPAAEDRRTVCGVRCCLLSATLCLCTALCAPLTAQDLDLRLWIAWGGGASREWEGHIQLTDPSANPLRRDAIVEFEAVGLSPDEPGSMYVEGRKLVIQPRTPRSYDAVSLRVKASRQSTLSVQLTPDDRSEAVRQIQVPLDQMVSEVHTFDLDERGNRLLIRRAPGDKLRVRFDRDNLVFAPGEQFDFYLDPHLVDIQPDEALVYQAELRRNRSDDTVWELTQETKADGRGDPPESAPFQLPLPSEEGVYNLFVSLARRRLPTRFSPTKKIHERILQLVVVSQQADRQTQDPWRVISEIRTVVDIESPQNGSRASKIWESLPKLPQWKWIPGSNSDESTAPLGNGLSRTAKRADRKFVQLLPGGWQAYPLAVRKAGVPHVVEIEFPGGIEQTLGISILETNSAGMVSPIGPSFGIDVPAKQTNSKATVDRHKVVFWPKTEKPVLLISNRSDNLPAEIGKIRVLSGPAQLPPQPIPAGSDTRLLALYFDQPLIAENFSATDSLDQVTGRSLKDWTTFLQAGTRLSQYVQYAGFNGAMVSVLHEGGAIYPSRLLQPTPKFDNGVFFGTGQDPMRKDVLELLFRLFDREGLKLVPALQFSAPLPELEDLLRPENRESRDSTELTINSPASPSRPAASANQAVDDILLARADGTSWRKTIGNQRPSGPHYNSLSPHVQAAIRRVVTELVDRYGKHASFGGVAIQLGPQTYAQFPDADWGTDHTTLARFAKDGGLTLPGLATRDPQRLMAYLSGDGRHRWLNWRARELAVFYRSMADDVSSRVPGSKLYFAGANMLNGSEIQSLLRPRLPEQFSLQQAMLRIGIDPTRLHDSPTTLALRPYRLAPQTNLDRQAVNLQLRHSREMDEIFGNVSSSPVGGASRTGLRALTGGLLYHEPQVVPITSFQQKSPFGADKTPDWLLMHLPAHAHEGRQWFVHNLATMDSLELFSGGWLGALGQHQALADIVGAYRRLPARRFQTIPSKSSNIQTAPIVVRQLRHNGKTYIYAVNDTPWPVNATLEIEAPVGATLEIFGNRQTPSPIPHRAGDSRSWSMALQPWDLIAAAVDTPNANVTDWQAQVGREVLAQLRSSVGDLRGRANRLRDPQPLRVLANPDFEAPVQDGVLTGWEYSRGPGMSVKLDSGKSRNGVRSLQVRSDGPVTWVRSNPFPAPTTGRLSVWVWLKIDDPNNQPPLQLAIEGRLNGQPYYRPARVGASDDWSGPAPPALTSEWAPYLVRIDNLPSIGLTDLRVAIDMMGRGEVWVDDVQVFDLWFDKTERTELLKKSAFASFVLGKGEVTQCGRLLQGYWPEFLRRHVTLDAPRLAATGDTRRAESEADSAPDADEPDASTSWLKKMIPRAPKMPTLFR